jgi:hypothetical protein
MKWMLTEQLRRNLEEYHRKKWFPDLYPDPYGELIDTLTIERILEFAESKDRPSLAAGSYLARVLPQVEFPGLLKEMRTAISKPIYRKKIRADSASFYVRALDDAFSRELWTHFREWNEDWRSALENWLKAKLDLRDRMSKLTDAHLSELKIDAGAWSADAKETLKATRDFFDFQINRHAPCGTMRELLRFFRWERWDSVADWTDFRALAKSFSELCHITLPPQMRRNESGLRSELGPPGRTGQASNSVDAGEAALNLFPILPPGRVRLQYGKAAGVVDAVRFLIAYARGCFYRGMNPELNIEDRICGDASLEQFWGCLYGQIMSTPAGVSRLIRPLAEPIAESVQLLFQFWYRYDAMLTFYESRVPASLKEAQDIYVDSFETAFSVEVPHFLFLYDLEAAENALSRAIAVESAVAATERLASLYGKQWFASSRFARRVRDYWWEGYRLTLSDVLQDLNVTITSSYPFL